MTVKNCSNCGTTNPVDAETCMVCSHTTFLAAHTPVAELDGAVVTDTTEVDEPLVIVVEVPVSVDSARPGGGPGF